MTTYIVLYLDGEHDIVGVSETGSIIWEDGYLSFFDGDDGLEATFNLSAVRSVVESECAL